MDMQLVSVVVPAGVVPGQQMTIQTATGKQAKVVVPMGAAPGSMFRVRLPAEAPVPQQMTPVPPPTNPNAVQVQAPDGRLLKIRAVYPCKWRPKKGGQVLGAAIDGVS